MHDFPFPSYLRTYRKRWALRQRDLGMLLGIPEAAISRYEKLMRPPTLEALIGAEFVFGVPARKIFPALYAAVEREVAARAAQIADVLSAADGTVYGVKRRLLEEIALRVASEKTNI